MKFLDRKSLLRPLAQLCLAAVTLFAAAEANAQGYYRQYSPYDTPQYYPSPFGYEGPYPSEGRSGYWQRNRSGTACRMGLGADPRYPEGPGNPRLGR